MISNYEGGIIIKKKSILAIMLIAMLMASLVIFTGCGSKEEKKEEPEAEVAEVLDEKTVKINGLEFKLDTESTFKEVNYTISGDLKKADFDRYIQYYYYQEDNVNLLFFRLFYYENKNESDAIADLGLNSSIALTDGKTDNFEYKFYEEPRDDGGTIHYYFVDLNGSTYVISFISKYDIKDFEAKVLKSIKF